ncbi:uncharacterized protein LOC135464163 [Liolophura sinensis]|uniref:uncharacterized protein LOC135464163 n=1 Tax=Liolophura sinensis TaxID=3198878 RepID=UPI0031592F31
MNRLIEVRGDQTPTQVSKSLFNIIQTGCSDPDPSSEMLREWVVQTYLTFIHRPTLPRLLLSVAVWVIGEYSHSVADFDAASACDGFIKHYQLPSTEEGSRHYIISSLRKLFLNDQISTSELQSFVNILESSTKGHNLQQRILELKMLANVETKFKDRLRTRSETSGQMMDFTLSFLDDYVTEALERGSLVYKPRQIRFSEMKKTSDVKSILDEINYDRYSSSVGSLGTGNSGEAGNGQPLEGSTDSVHSGSGKIENRTTGLNLSGVKKVWGRGGVTQSDTPPLGRITDVRPGDRDTLEQYQQPPGKHQMDEERRRKEDLAAALFSGVSGTTSFSAMVSGCEDPKGCAGHVTPSEPASIGLGLAERQPKLADILVKQKPTDGHDWRKFKKQEENSSGMPNQFDHLNPDLEVKALSETSTNLSSENFMNSLLVSSSETVTTLHSGGSESQPSQEEHSTDDNQVPGMYSVESPTPVESQSSLYDLLRSELTEEELQQQQVEEPHDQS